MRDIIWKIIKEILTKYYYIDYKINNEWYYERDNDRDNEKHNGIDTEK